MRWLFSGGRMPKCQQLYFEDSKCACGKPVRRIGTSPAGRTRYGSQCYECYIKDHPVKPWVPSPEKKAYADMYNKSDAGRASMKKYYKTGKGMDSRWAGGLKRQFNITPDDYIALMFKCGALCSICRQPEITKDPKSGRTRLLAVDHCHKTGKVRGLLCNGCNHILGLAGDDPEILNSAVQYIEQNK